MKSLEQIQNLGQSIWVDHITRGYLESGQFENHLRKGVMGVTSNPTILLKAIGDTRDYENDLAELLKQGKDSIDIYEEFIRRDISVAASLLHFKYASTDTIDGYISIEVDPAFAHRTDATECQASYLNFLIDCPNVMIKVPGTDAGIEAFERLIYDGINVNVTLLFSLDQYEKVAWAYVRALEARHKDGRPIDTIGSVASFFVSRIDTAVDARLDVLSQDKPSLSEFRGQAAIANCRLVYDKYYQVFHSPEFVRIRNRGGAKPQRVLWASTSVKDPAYAELKYVHNLIAPGTVNTLPLSTLDTIVECKSSFRAKLPEFSTYKAQAHIDELATIGINLNDVTTMLLDDGLQKFAKSFDVLMCYLYSRTKGVACPLKF